MTLREQVILDVSVMQGGIDHNFTVFEQLQYMKMANIEKLKLNQN